MQCTRSRGQRDPKETEAKVTRGSGAGHHISAHTQETRPGRGKRTKERKRGRKAEARCERTSTATALGSVAISAGAPLAAPVGSGRRCVNSGGRTRWLSFLPRGCVGGVGDCNAVTSFAPASSSSSGNTVPLLISSRRHTSLHCRRAALTSTPTTCPHLLRVGQRTRPRSTGESAQRHRASSSSVKCTGVPTRCGRDRAGREGFSFSATPTYVGSSPPPLSQSARHRRRGVFLNAAVFRPAVRQTLHRHPTQAAILRSHRSSSRAD